MWHSPDYFLLFIPLAVYTWWDGYSALEFEPSCQSTSVNNRNLFFKLEKCDFTYSFSNSFQGLKLRKNNDIEQGYWI
jgi:hypothetical protein